ncbi:MAG: BRO family protein [Caenibius sp.]
MSALIPLHFDRANIRMVMLDGEPWWVCADVAKSLGLANPRQVLARLEDYEKGVHIVDTLGGPQAVTIINESGFYSLLLTSRKPVAKAMKRWLTTEALPSIRKYGCYPPPPPRPLPPIDDETPWDGMEKTIGQRFREERERWEAENPGYTLAKSCPGLSKQIVIAIESDWGGIRKGKRMEMLLYMGIDVLYVMTGRRTLTSAERAMRDAYRIADPAARADILGSALALPRASEID